MKLTIQVNPRTAETIGAPKNSGVTPMNMLSAFERRGGDPWRRGSTWQRALRLLAMIVFLFSGTGMALAECKDDDGDGYGAPASDDCTHSALDCDDSNPDVYPGATEICDGIDGDCDCDEDKDEGFDLDGDGKLECIGQDCDENDATVFKGATEICDGKDNDCNGKIDDVVDMDEDGYTSCPDSGDCNDNDPAINPGATEICGNSVDEDCDGNLDNDCLLLARRGDEDFGGTVMIAGGPETCNGVDDDGDNAVDEGFNVGAPCLARGPDPVTGPCFEPGTRTCLPDGTGTYCPPDDGTVEYELEGPVGAPNCTDGMDNDCNGFLDQNDPGCQGPEVCDGFDNNHDGFVDEAFPDLDTVCFIGVGACRGAGFKVCAPDGLGTVCNAMAGTPGQEGPEGTAKCFDNIDNDCDGLTDLADDDCTADERCDGRDNDNNGQTDETFADLGDPCTAGDGGCMASGEMVCAADGDGTVCSAVRSLGIPEGPDGVTCFDGIDNDCNGMTDLDDPMCASALMTVTCALEPGVCRNCVGWYRLRFEASGHRPNAVITAELVALNAAGEELAVLPVEEGDFAKLGALRYPDDCIVAESVGGKHQILAPVPMLRVTVQDSLNKRAAFCTNIPYVDVIEPSGQVIVDSQGDVTPVFAAIPLIDLVTLKVLVDGVDIIAALGIDPVNDLPGGPFSGMVVIGSELVTVQDLYIDAEPLGVHSSNTLRMKLLDLGCGGHAVVFDGEMLPGSLELPQPVACHMDDLHDLGCSTGFGIEIDTPVAGEIIDQVPTPVIGEICHGLPIVSAMINGMSLDPSDVIFTPNQNECSAGTYRWPIDELIPRTQLRVDLDTLNGPFGRFDQGANRLVVDAIDERDNRAFETPIFATTPLAGVTVVQSGGGNVVVAGVPAECGNPPAECCPDMNGFLPDVFVAGLSRGAIVNFYKAVISRDDVQEAIRSSIVEGILSTPTVKQVIACIPLCDPTIYINLVGAETPGFDDFDFPNALDLTIPDDPDSGEADQGRLNVKMFLPPIKIFVEVDGGCCTEICCVPTPFGCIDCCADSKNIDVDLNVTLNGDAGGWFIQFSVNEDQLRGMGNPVKIKIEPPKEVITVFTKDDVSIGGLVVVAATFLVFVIGTFLGALIGMPGLGFTGVLALFIFLDAFLKAESFFDQDIIKDAIKAAGPSIPLDELDFMFTQDLSQLMLKAETEQDQLEIITEQGINVTLNGKISPTMKDPCIPQTAGFPLTCANAPLWPQTVAHNTYITLSDDVVDQLLESVRVAGKLPTNFQTGAVVGDIIPNANVPPASVLLNCNGMTANTPLLLKASADMAPVLTLADNPATDVVEAALRLNDVSVQMVADRDNDGLIAGAPPGNNCPALPQCVSSGGSLFGCTPMTTDCDLYSACLDLLVNVDLDVDSIIVDGVDTPRITFNNLVIIPTTRAQGVVCNAPTGGSMLVPPATADMVLTTLVNSLGLSIPPFVLDGLSLDVNACEVGPDINPGQLADGFGCTSDAECASGKCLPLLRVADPKLIALESNADASLQDYVGITGELVTCAGVACDPGMSCNPQSGACEPD